MPDITMCRNEHCQDKTECYRYMAKPSDYQSMTVFDGTNRKDCIVFIPNDLINGKMND